MTDAGTQVLTELVPDATSGNVASVEIAASPEQVWRALHELTLGECRVTGALIAIRSIPAAVTRRGAFRRRRSGSPAPTVLGAMVSNRFTELHSVPPQMIVLGVIGQFWRPSGGVDVVIGDVQAFKDFAESGYVKSAIGFFVEPLESGSRLTTETRNQPTDEEAARRFARYWRAVGWGSRLTRYDMLRATRRRAER